MAYNSEGISFDQNNHLLQLLSLIDEGLILVKRNSEITYTNINKKVGKQKNIWNQIFNKNNSKSNTCINLKDVFNNYDNIVLKIDYIH